MLGQHLNKESDTSKGYQSIKRRRITSIHSSLDEGTHPYRQIKGRRPLCRMQST